MCYFVVFPGRKEKVQLNHFRELGTQGGKQKDRKKQPMESVNFYGFKSKIFAIGILYFKLIEKFKNF